MRKKESEKHTRPKLIKVTQHEKKYVGIEKH